MYKPIIISIMSFLTIATCQNQTAVNKTAEAETSTSTAASSANTNSTMQNNTPTREKGEPKVSPGLPPDKEAIKTAENEAANSSKTGVVYLSEGENTFFKEYQMNVTFKRMIEDSRCPKGVNCIWAGVATAEVEFMGTHTRPMTFHLSTINDANKGYTSTRNFNGYDITLVGVTPETTSEKGFKALSGKYKIGLKFVRTNSGGAATTR